MPDYAWFFFIVVGLPVIFGVGGDLLKRWMKFKERQMELMGAQTAERAAQYAAATERLEKRVRVLERIVTDRGLALTHEIESLREADGHGLAGPVSHERPRWPAN